MAVIASANIEEQLVQMNHQWLSQSSWSLWLWSWSLTLIIRDHQMIIVYHCHHLPQEHLIELTCEGCKVTILLEILKNDHHDNLRLCQQINDDDYDKNYDLCTMTMVLHENRDADDTSILIVMTNHFRWQCVWQKVELVRLVLSIS